MSKLFLNFSLVSINIFLISLVNAPIYNFINCSKYFILPTNWNEINISAIPLPQKTDVLLLNFIKKKEHSVISNEFKVKTIETNLNSSKIKPNNSDSIHIFHSGVLDFKVSEEILARLNDLGKIWGLLKYRHPEIAKGNYEWDLELFKAINEIVSAKNDTEIEEFYINLLNSLGPVKNFSKKVNKGKVFQEGNYSWIDKLPYNQKLKKRLINLRYASFSKHHYFAFNQGIGNVRIENENGYLQLNNPDVGFRLLTLFRFWNIVQYFSPYRELTDRKWDEVLTEYIPKMIIANNQLKYEYTVASMVTEIKDAHTILLGNTKALNLVMGQKIIPVDFIFADGKAIINNVHVQNSSDIRTGDILLKKNGRNVKEIQDSVFHLITSPNPAVINRGMAQILRRSIAQTYILEIDRGGEHLKIQANTIPINEFKITIDTSSLKYLENDIAYLNFETLSSKTLLENKKKIFASKGIILDLRCYPKDVLLHNLITPFLIKKETPFVKFTLTNYSNLGEFILSGQISIQPNSVDSFSGKIAILVNAQTQSNAEFQAMAYQVAPNAKVFGSQTAGADGNVSRFTLPGGLMSSISGVGVYYPDGSETQRKGVVLDVEINPTIKGIRDGRDEVLEEALKFLIDR